MITKSEGFGNCGNKIHTDFGANAFDKVNLRGNYRIASLEYNTLTNELIINQYPDVSKTVVLGESNISRNITTSHKDAISGILEWANMSIDDFNNLDKTKNYVVYNANNPESDRYLYYTYDKSLGEWSSSSLAEGDEFFNIEDGIKYRYENNKIVDAVDVTLTARNTVTNGKSTGITLEVSPTTGSSVHLDLVGNQYAGLMSPEDKTKLDNIESSIGAVLELGNPSSGRVPLYLKTKDGEILSTVNLDEDDYIDSIVASIATQDNPDKGIKAGDKILTFTLTNGNEIVISLEGWFIYYTGLKTDAIDTVVVENKIKSTLLLDPNSDNLSEISSNGLLTKLLWQSEDESVKFIKGLKSSYDSILYSGYIYFTTDTKEVIVNGQAYGIDLTASDLNLIEKLETDTDIPGRIKVTKSNGGVYYINIPDVTTTSNGLMLSEDKAKLDSIEDGAQVNILEGIKINNITQPIEGKVATLNVYDKAQVNSLVANSIKYKGESTSIGNLPTSKEVGDSYKITVEKLGLATDAVVFWDGDKWSTFTGNLDLSNYATKQDLENSSSGNTSEFDKKLESKVDKIEGSSLVSDTEIDKLLYIDSYVKTVDSSIISGKINLDVTTRTPSNKGAEVVGHIILQEASSTNNGLMSSKHYDVIEALNLDGNYLDKTGTPSSTWQLSKNTGPKIKNSGGQFELRNASDDTYADLIVKDLTITGNVTQEGSSFITQAETVEVTDNTILLNKGEVGAGVTKGYAGLEVDRGTLPLYKIYFDESDDRFKAGSGTDLWPIMLRDEESTLTDGDTLIWDAANKRAKTGKNLDTELANYLPLTAGSTKPLTDSLYINGGANDYTGININANSAKEVSIGLSSGSNTWKISSRSNLNNGNLMIFHSNIPLVQINEDGKLFASNGVNTTNLSVSGKVYLSHTLNSESMTLGNSDAILTISTADGDISHIRPGKPTAKVWDSENDGVGSGLDADLLDGKQGSEYALVTDLETETAKYLPLTGGTVTGTLSVVGNNVIRIGQNGIISMFNNTFMLGSATAADELYLVSPGGIFYANGSINYKIWHEGNDGTGSGLDADLLDGKQSSDFLPSTNAVHTGVFRVNPNPDPYSEGIRIANASNDWSNIQFGSDPNASTGLIENQWIIGKSPAGTFMICPAGQESTTVIASRGLSMPSGGGIYYNGVALVVKDQLPTSLPANGGNADTISNYPITNLMAHKGGTNNLDTLQGTSIYAWGGTNIPGNPGHDYGTVMQFGNVPDLVPGIQDHWLFQMAVAANSRIYVRQRVNTGIWEAWSALAYTSDIPAAPDLSKYVDISSTQTITGAKTFTSAVTGTNGFYDTSDIRLKSNVKEIELNSEKIRLCEFDKGDKHSYGVIAQEVEKLYPSTVQEGKEGYKVVNYNEILTIKCAELEAENKALKDRLNRLEQSLMDKGIL